MSEHDWQPLLHGETAESARALVREVVDAVELQHFSTQVGLKGDAAIALLLALCGRSSASARLEAALRSVAMQPMTISLFGGVAGISWIVQQLADRCDIDEVLAHFDAAVMRYLDVRWWDERCDLVNGLAGIGVSVSGRRDARAFDIADKVLSHLEATAVVCDSRVTWRRPPQFLGTQQRMRFPDGTFELGVAHGVTGIVGMLAQFVDADLDADRSARLLESALAWVIDSISSDSSIHRNSAQHAVRDVTPLGWCHGDLGIAAALLYTGGIIGSARGRGARSGIVTTDSATT